MIFQNIVKLVIFLSIPQYLLLAIFLFTNKKGKPFANKILGFFFLAQTFSFLNTFARLHRDTLIFFAPDILFVFSGFIFLWAPLMYFYILALTNTRQYFVWRDLLHLIPFFLQFGYLLIFLIRFPFDIKLRLLSEESFPNIIVWRTFVLSLYTLAGFYVVQSIKTWRIYYNRTINDALQNAGYRIAWIRLLIICCSLEFSTAFIDFLFAVFQIDSTVRMIWLLFVMGIPAIVVMIVMLKGLRTPEIFSGPIEKMKYSTSHLQANEKEDIRARLEQMLHNEKLYRNPSLTLETLARSLSTKSKYLSQIINEFYGMSFHEWINKYRIEESKEVLLDQKDPGKTVLEILYEVGFNSKASFNNAFKSSTKMTPTEYRKHYRHLPNSKR